MAGGQGRHFADVFRQYLVDVAVEWRWCGIAQVGELFVEQGRALEQAVGLVDDVMGVVNLLHVPGDAAAPVRYPLAQPGN